MQGDWLRASLVVPQVPAASRDPVVDAAVRVLAPASGLEPDTLRKILLGAFESEGFSLGKGVAIPHVEVEGLAETLVCLVTSREPVPLPSIDGIAPDVFLFVLSKRDPRGHLLLLAHLASLAQSRTFLSGLREARTADEVMALVDAAEQRHRVQRQAPLVTTQAVARVLVIISVSGEKLVDAILLDLVDRGFQDACMLEAQSLRDAAANEVPLFAGFRDIFGDPGGRRLMMVEAASEDAPGILEAVQRSCEEHRSEDAAVSVVPVQTSWRAPRAERREARGAH